MLHRAPRKHAGGFDVDFRHDGGLNIVITISIAIGRGLAIGRRGNCLRGRYETVGGFVVCARGVVGEVGEVGVVCCHVHLMEDCGVDGGGGLACHGQVVDVVDVVRGGCEIDGSVIVEGFVVEGLGWVGGVVTDVVGEGVSLYWVDYKEEKGEY